jgi:acetyltransferase-like isoleucine patch superfamily enzyme
MNTDSWYSEQELFDLGISDIGKNVLISKKCSIYGAHNIKLGSNIRIDDFCVLACSKGNFILDGYNHIGCFCYINSGGGIHMKMFSGLSSRCSLYSSSQNYDGSSLTNPTIDGDFLEMNIEPISIGKHSVIGTNTVILPGCSVGDYSAVGACSLVTKNISSGKMAKGIPAKEYKDRDYKKIQNLESTFLKGQH